MVLAVAHSSSRLVAASRSAVAKAQRTHLRAASTSGTITGTSSAKGGSNGHDGRPSPTTATTNASGHRGGKGVRIFFETQAMAYKRRQQRLQQQQQRGKRTDNKGRDREQPQLLKTFRPSPSEDTGSENRKGSGDSKAGLSVPYRPFVFPGDAYRYPFYTSSSRRQTTGDDNSNAAPLPLLDSSPLLDPARYCKKSALPGGTTTVSGGDAARRLGRGRTRLGEIVRNQLVSLDGGGGGGGSGGGSKITGTRKAIRRADGRGTREHDNENKGQNRGTPFSLDGTGIPRALMQGSLDLADELLRSMDGAAEISFGNCYDGSLDFNVLRVRSRMGDNDPQSWPLVQENWMPSGEYRSKSYMESWEHRMQLYLTVMNRLSRAFGGMIDPAIESVDSKLISTDLPERDSDDQDGFVDDQNNDTDAEAVTASNNKLDFDLRSWNASFMRGLAFPPNMIPDCQLGPLLGRSAGFESRAGYVSPPIVELNQSVGSVACPTHVRITIQGTPSASAAGSRIISSNRAVIRRKRVSPITLVFDGKFSRGDVSSS